jgi:hypothetical protein
MNRKKYGNTVRPVRKKKLRIKLPKPRVVELRRVYAKLKKAATWQRLGILCEAIQWYRTALNYVHQVKLLDPKEGYEYSAVAAKALVAFNHHHDTMVNVNIDAEKERHAIDALNAAQKFCQSQDIKAIPVQPYLKKYKLVAKKLDTLADKATSKYDKILTLITQACDSPFALKVAPRLTESHKIDNVLKTVFYSTAHVKKLSERYRKQGLLSLVVSEGPIIARAMSYKDTDKGLFIPDEGVQLKIFLRMMDNFIDWATTSQFAPKNVLRRPRKKKVKKAA